MIRKHHQILAAILVAQLALSVVVFWPQPSVAGQREPVFPDLDAEDVTRLTIEDSTGSVIKLARVTGEWVLPEADQYPAQADAVNGLLEKLTALTTGRLVARSNTSHRRLQVASDDFARRIGFVTSDGAEETVYVGSSPQYGSVHFRREGQSETYLTSELTTRDANPSFSAWIDTSYHSITQADVTGITLQNAEGTFVFEREDEETWTMEEPAALDQEETLNQAQVRTVLREAAAVKMKRPLGKEEQTAYGLDDPSAIVTLQTPDRTVTLHVGAEDPEDGSYVVKSSESDYYVHVAGSGVSTLVESGRQTFVQEPTPQPESSDS